MPVFISFKLWIIFLYVCCIQVAQCMDANLVLAKAETQIWDLAAQFTPDAFMKHCEKYTNHLKVLQSLKEHLVEPDSVLDKELAKTQLMIDYCVRRLKALHDGDEILFSLGQDIEAVDIFINDDDFRASFKKREVQLNGLTKKKLQLAKAPVHVIQGEAPRRRGSMIVPNSPRVVEAREETSATSTLASNQNSPGFFGLILHALVPQQPVQPGDQQKLALDQTKVSPSEGTPRLVARTGSLIARPSAASPISPKEVPPTQKKDEK